MKELQQNKQADITCKPIHKHTHARRHTFIIIIGIDVFVWANEKFKVNAQKNEVIKDRYSSLTAR